jgi:23S rRNA pseudouridine1911/1915/1917 synthase
MPLDILFEDHHLIVVNKPAPLLTQAPPHLPSLEAMVKSYIKDKYSKPAGVYLGVPHRLDRPVSGVVCFTRNTKASQRVHAQFEARTVRKVYWAIARGGPADDSGVWSDWLRKVPEESRTVPSSPEEPGAKSAILRFRVLERGVDSCLLELQPETGRMHQLRVQCALRGHPIRGDAIYGDGEPFGPIPAEPRDRTIALHARLLELEHPFRKERLSFVAGVPESWRAIPFETVAASVLS